MICLAVSSLAVAASPEQFLRRHNAPEEIIVQMLAEAGPIRRCLANDDQIICIIGRTCPNISTNPQARQAILQGLGIAVRNDLCAALTHRVQAANLRDEQVVGQTFLSGISNGNLKFEHIEFTSFCRENWCGAAAISPLHIAKTKLPPIYESPAFISAYCQHLLAKAAGALEKEESAGALAALKELVSLKFADVRAYLLAMKAFMAEKQPLDAAKIANELLDNFSQKLDPEQAEELGDMLVELDMPDKAVVAYNIAIDGVMMARHGQNAARE